MVPVESQSDIPGSLPVVTSKELGNLKVGMSLYLGAFFLVYVGVYIPHMEIPKIDVSENMDSLYANLEGVQESLSTVLPAGNVLQKFDIDILKETLEDGFNGAWSRIGSLVENASINKGEYSVVDEGYVSDEDDMKTDEKITPSEGAIAIDEVDAPLEKQVDEKEIEKIEQEVSEDHAESMATLEVESPYIEEYDTNIIEEDIPALEAMNQDEVPTTIIAEEKVPVVEEEIIPEIAYTVGSEEFTQEETMPTAIEAVPIKVPVVEEEIIPEMANTVGSEEITKEETMPTATEAVPVLGYEATTEEESKVAGEGEIKADMVEETIDAAVEVTETLRLAEEDTETAPIGLEAVAVKEESVFNEGNIPLDTVEKKIVPKSEHRSELDAASIDEETKSEQTEAVGEDENSPPIVSENNPIKEEFIVNDAARDSVPTDVKETAPLKEEVKVDEDGKNNPIINPKTESHSEVKSK